MNVLFSSRDRKTRRITLNSCVRNGYCNATESHRCNTCSGRHREMNCQFLITPDEKSIELSSNSNGFLLQPSMNPSAMFCQRSAKLNEISRIFERNSQVASNRIHVAFQPTLLDCCEDFEKKTEIYENLQAFLRKILAKDRKIILITAEVKPCNLSRIPPNIVSKVRIQNGNLQRINEAIKWITNKIEKEGVELRVRRDRRDRIMTRSYKSITAIHMEDLNMLKAGDYCANNGAHLSGTGFEKITRFVRKITE